MVLEPVIYECLHCNTLFSRTEVMSYTVHGKTEVWSDGKTLNFNIPEYLLLPFARCENCKKLFWFDNCKKPPKQPDSEINIKQIDYPPIEYFTDSPEYFITDLREMIENKMFANKEQELYLRIKLWQSINDLIRYSGLPLLKHLKSSSSVSDFLNFKPLQSFKAQQKQHKKLYTQYTDLRINNQNRLISLLEQNLTHTENKIFLIENYREQNKFGRAKYIIKMLDTTEKNDYKKFLKHTRFRLFIQSAQLFKYS